MRPVPQPIGTPYGVPGHMWACGHHTGTDFLAPSGTTVKAVASGRVVHAGPNSSTGWGAAYGTHVIIESVINGHIYRVLYAHLSHVSVKAGAKFVAGHVVGESGATGNVTGPHLHLEIRKAPYRYGDDVDPMPLIDPPAPKPAKPARPKHVKAAIKSINDALATAGPTQTGHLKKAKAVLKKINKR